MGNYFDYLIWRGDLSFEASPLNEVDITIFAMSPMVDLSACLEKDEVKPLHQAFIDYEKGGGNMDKPLGLIIPNDIVKLFGIMSRSVRFKDILVGNYERRLDIHRVGQFAAHTVDIAGVRLICYSGTDDTTVGWEESFSMMIRHKIPAQALAVKYLQKHYMPDRPNILVGHSKGGNLAMYAYVHAGKEIQAKIERVYSMDGPGTMFEKWEKVDCSKIIEVIPQDSTVGRLFNHYGTIKVVKSTHIGLNQHDTFSWLIEGTSYVPAEQTEQSKVTTRVINETITSMSEDERKDFVEVISRLFANAQANTLTELEQKKSALLKSFLSEHPQKRKVLTKIMLKIFAVKEVRDTVWQGLRENQKNVERVRKEKEAAARAQKDAENKIKAEQAKQKQAEDKRKREEQAKQRAEQAKAKRAEQAKQRAEQAKIKADDKRKRAEQAKQGAEQETPQNTDIAAVEVVVDEYLEPKPTLD